MENSTQNSETEKIESGFFLVTRVNGKIKSIKPLSKEMIEEYIAQIYAREKEKEEVFQKVIEKMLAEKGGVSVLREGEKFIKLYIVERVGKFNTQMIPLTYDDIKRIVEEVERDEYTNTE
ncbi:MAG: hypothetical protein QXI16_07425 [Sulfolobaceae archaeon]